MNSVKEVLRDKIIKLIQPQASKTLSMAGARIWTKVKGPVDRQVWDSIGNIVCYHIKYSTTLGDFIHEQTNYMQSRDESSELY